ncbi:hypothetical protein D9M68_507670 [compost metagenome]
MLAMTVARRLPRNAKITSTTSTTASTSSISTCCTDERMPAVRSLSTSTCRPAGMPACSSGSCFLMALTVAITLAPGWRCTFRMMAGVSCTCPSTLRPAQAPSCVFSALLTTRATSTMRIGAPFL